MKRIGFLWIFVLITSCIPDLSPPRKSELMTQALEQSSDFNSLKSTILLPHCIACHDWAQSEANVLERIVPGQPDSSRFYQMIKSGQMPPTGGPLSNKELEIAYNYIEQLTKENLPAVETPTPTTTLTSQISYSNLSTQLFQKSCIQCHNSNGRTRPVLDTYESVAFNAGTILNSLTGVGRKMPPTNRRTGQPEAPLPPIEVIEAFRQWIDLGKPH